MVFDPTMALAVTGNVASSSEYNKVVNNVLDLDARVTGISSSRPYVHVYQSNGGQQSIPNTTPTVITFNSEVIDGSGFHSTVSNTSRITPNVAGRYYVTAGVCMDPSPSSGSYLAQIRKNGAVVLGSAPYQDKQFYSSGFTALMAQCHATILCNGTTD